MVGLGTKVIRSFRGGDAKHLAQLDNAQMVQRVRDVVPRRASDYHLSPLLQSVMKARIEAWVIEENGLAVGFARAVMSPNFEIAQLTPTPLPAGNGAAGSRKLLATALRWIEVQKTPRVMTDLPDHRTGSRGELEAIGFEESLRLRTLAKPLAL